METEIKLNRIDDVLAGLEYPVTPPTVVDPCGEVIVRLAEGTVRERDRTVERRPVRRKRGFGTRVPESAPP